MIKKKRGMHINWKPVGEFSLIAVRPDLLASHCGVCQACPRHRTEAQRLSVHRHGRTIKSLLQGRSGGCWRIGGKRAGPVR